MTNFDARLKRLEGLAALAADRGDPADLDAWFRGIAAKMTPEQRVIGREALSVRFGSWDEVFAWFRGQIVGAAPYDHGWLPPALSASSCIAAGLYPGGPGDEFA